MPKIPVGNTFLQRQSSQTLLDQLPPIGRRHEIVEDAKPDQPRPFYSHPNGTLWLGDSIVWLKSIETATVDLIFADPPYNIGKADWDEFDSHDAYAGLVLQEQGEPDKGLGTLSRVDFALPQESKNHVQPPGYGKSEMFPSCRAACQRPA
jgi:hypothetical protein